MEEKERCYSFILSRTPHETQYYDQTGEVNSKFGDGYNGCDVITNSILLSPLDGEVFIILDLLDPNLSLEFPENVSTGRLQV
jgi:hypothetical protein